MKTFKVGDKVKIPIIGTASLPTTETEIQQALFDYKLDYLYVCQVWEEDDEIGLIRGDDVELTQDLYHKRDLEHYEEYNETFNPINHSDLVIDFDKEQIDLDSEFTGALNELLLSKVETIEEIAQRHSDQNHIVGDFYKQGFIEGVNWCKKQLKN